MQAGSSLSMSNWRPLHFNMHAGRSMHVYLRPCCLDTSLISWIAVVFVLSGTTPVALAQPAPSSTSVPPGAGRCTMACTEQMCVCPSTTAAPTTTTTTTLPSTTSRITSSTSTSTSSTTTSVSSTSTTTPTSTTNRTTTTQTTTWTTATPGQTTTSASSPSPGGQGTSDDLTTSQSGPTTASLNDDTTTTNPKGSADFPSGGNLPVIIAVVITSVVVVGVVLVAIFLLRRKGVICAAEPEEGLPQKSTDTKDSRNKNRYSDIPSASVHTNSQRTHDSGTRSSNGAAKPPGFSGKTRSDVENSDGPKTPAVYLTLEPDSSRVVPSAPVYFTVEADSTSGLPGNAARDNSAASNMAADGNADDVYHEIDDRDVRPEETDDEYNKLGEKKATKTESGAVYGHLESGDVDYDHVTKRKKNDVRVRHNDYDVAPAARVDSGDYNHVTREARSDVTVAGSDYDVARPRKQSVSQDEGDYDHPPHPKKVKEVKGHGAPAAISKGATAGSYELAAPISPGGPVAGAVSTAAPLENVAEESRRHLDQPGLTSSGSLAPASPYELASSLSSGCPRGKTASTAELRESPAIRSEGQREVMGERRHPSAPVGNESPYELASKFSGD